MVSDIDWMMMGDKNIKFMKKLILIFLFAGLSFRLFSCDTSASKEVDASKCLAHLVEPGDDEKWVRPCKGRLSQKWIKKWCDGTCFEVHQCDGVRCHTFFHHKPELDHHKEHAAGHGKHCFGENRYDKEKLCMQPMSN